MVELRRESSAPLPACVQQAFRQHEKSAKVMLLPAIKCACAAIDLQLFLWRYDRLGFLLLGYLASAGSLAGQASAASNSLYYCLANPRPLTGMLCC